MENYAGLPTDEVGLLAQYERIKGSNDVIYFDAEDEGPVDQRASEAIREGSLHRSDNNPYSYLWMYYRPNQF